MKILSIQLLTLVQGNSLKYICLAATVTDYKTHFLGVLRLAFCLSGSVAAGKEARSSFCFLFIS